jgi:hypothetical protein
VQASSSVRYTDIETAGVTAAGISRANFQFSPQGLTIILNMGSGAPELPNAWENSLPTLSPEVIDTETLSFRFGDGRQADNLLQ